MLVKLGIFHEHAVLNCMLSLSHIACTQCIDACGLLLLMSPARTVVCVSVCHCVCLLDTRVSCAQTAAPIDVPFGG